MSRILVTGGLGFIGHHLCTSLLQERHSVTIVDNKNDYGTFGRNYLDALYDIRLNYIKNEAPTGELEVSEEDIRSFWCTKNFETIIYLAQVPRQHEVSLNPEEASDILVTGLFNLFSQERVKKIKHFIFISTSMVYGDFNANTDEEVSLNPKSQYGVMRMMGEKFVIRHCQLNNIPYTIIRPSAVYGPRDTYNRVVGQFFSRAMKAESIFIRGSNQVLDFTYVKDLAYGIRLCVNNPESYNQIFNMTRSFQGQYTLGLLANRIKSLTQSRSLLIEEERDQSFPKRSILDISKAHARLGYTPQTDLDEGLYQTYAWLKAHPNLLE